MNTHSIEILSSLLYRGELQVLWVQPVHEERHQGWEQGWLRFPLLQWQQVQVLDLQPKVRKAISFNFPHTGCPSAGWRLLTRGKVCRQRAQCQGRKHAGHRVIFYPGSGIQVKVAGVLLEDPETFPTSGYLTSPNFPLNYPNNLHQRRTIEVPKGSVVNIHFTDFEVESWSRTGPDYVELINGDGTLLRRIHSIEHARGNITSVTETLHVLFHTDHNLAKRGWSLEWWSMWIWNCILTSFLRYPQTYKRWVGNRVA